MQSFASNKRIDVSLERTKRLVRNGGALTFLNKTNVKQNNARGITLIALVVSIIVLLILAGVTINAIVGNDSTMDKAQKAKAETEKADELDTIKLAVVDAVALGTDGRVSKANLVTALRKIPEVVASTDVDALDASDNTTGPWTIVGKKGSYTVTASSAVTRINGLSITGSLTIDGGAVQEITVTKTGSAASKGVSWSKSGNITFVTDLTGATEIASPTGDTVYVKAGAYSSSNESSNTGSVTVSAIGEDGVSCNITIVEPIALLKDQTRGTVLSTTKNTKLKDNKGNKIIIPANFMISNDNANNGDAGNNVEEGIIIEDASGNQFVWIPVGTITRSSGSTTTIGLSRYEFASDGTATAKNPSDTIDSHYTETTSNTVARKDGDGNIEAVEKAKAYKGFYIGRYETGTGNVSKYNVAAYTNVTRDQAKTNAQGMYVSNTTLYKSDLMNSYAWDTAIVFIQNCGANSTYSRQNTGKANDEQCHINDMAGNVMEWTTEYSSTSGYPCVRRGGDYINSLRYTALRISNDTSSSYDYIGFRALLYIM